MDEHKKMFSAVLEQIKEVQVIYKFQNLNWWTWEKRYGNIENRKRQILPSFLAGNHSLSGYNRAHLPNSGQNSIVKIYFNNEDFCSCPDFVFRCKGRNKTKKQCKHMEIHKRRKAVEVGFSKNFGHMEVGKLISSFM